MRTLLLYCSITIISATALAQDIPSEVVGDTALVSFTYQGTPVSYTVVRAAEGHVWLQQNLGAAQVADSSIGAQAYGDLYQWGRWTDGHQLRTSPAAQASTLSPNNPLGLGGGSPFFYIGADPSHWWSAGNGTDTWTDTVASDLNGIDPCTAIGPEWELPSKADWTNLLTQEGITNLSTAFASSLKLVAAGSRDGQTGTLINVGAYGNYWSNTASSIYAKDLTIGDSFVNADDDAYRSYGMSVRCLNKSLHVGLIEHPTPVRIELFPNPTNGAFTVTTNDAMIKRIDVYTMDMRSLRTYVVGTSTTTLALDASMANGLYWLSISTDKGTERHTLLLER